MGGGVLVSFLQDMVRSQFWSGYGPIRNQSWSKSEDTSNSAVPSSEDSDSTPESLIKRSRDKIIPRHVSDTSCIDISLLL